MSTSEQYVNAIRSTKVLSPNTNYGSLYDETYNLNRSEGKITQTVFNDVTLSGKITHINSSSLQYCIIIIYKTIDDCPGTRDLPVEVRYRIIMRTLMQLIDRNRDTSRNKRKMYELTGTPFDGKFIMKLLNNVIENTDEMYETIYITEKNNKLCGCLPWFN